MLTISFKTTKNTILNVDTYFDYNYDDISSFRNNIIKYITPICKLMSEWQKEELGLDELKYYDTVFFSSMPESKYIDIELLKQLKESFQKCDADLSNLFNKLSQL